MLACTQKAANLCPLSRLLRILAAIRTVNSGQAPAIALVLPPLPHLVHTKRDEEAHHKGRCVLRAFFPMAFARGIANSKVRASSRSVGKAARAFATTMQTLARLLLSVTMSLISASLGRA